MSKDDPTIVNLLNCLPEIDEIHKSSKITLDGVSTVLINRTKSTPSILYFRNEENFHINKYTNEESTFLHNLFIHIEKLIGNLKQTNY